nr:hypothetical protein [uncultured Campylobacter sp.]
MGFIDTAKFISQKIGSLIQVNSVKKLTKRIKGLEKLWTLLVFKAELLQIRQLAT